MTTAAPDKTKDKAPQDEAQDEAKTEARPSPIDALLESTRSEYEAQLEELRPSHEAFMKLDAIIRNFQGIADGTIRTDRKRGTSATADRAGRGQRPAEFLSIVRASGEAGVTVTEAADHMDGMNPNYLYRLAKELTEKGDLRKEGKRYYAA